MSGRHKTQARKEYDRKLGENIRLARLRAKLTQGELGKVAQMDQGNFSRVEKGKQTLQPDQLDRVASKLGVSVDALRPGAEPQDAEVDPAEVRETTSKSDPESRLPPLVAAYFRERELLDDEKDFLRGVAPLKFRGQELSFEVLDEVVAALRRSNPRPGPSGASR